MACVRAALVAAFLVLLVASFASAAKARCLAGACPGSGASSLLQVSGGRRRTVGVSAPQRLHILTVTGPGKYELFAIQAWEHQKAYLGPYDNYTHICEAGCGSLAVRGRRLTHMLPMTEEAFPSGSCVGVSQGQCAGYEFSQMKWGWGLIHEWRDRRSAGTPMPEWWFLKDDDTYFRADRLMDLVSGIDPRAERVIVGKRGPYPVHVQGRGCAERVGPAWWYGGSGILLSVALVEVLVTQYADPWLRLQEKQIQFGCPYYDQHIATVVSWVDDVRVLDYPDHFDEAGYVEDGMPVGIDDTTVAYHMGEVRKALGDDVALVRVSELFS